MKIQYRNVLLERKLYKIKNWIEKGNPTKEQMIVAKKWLKLAKESLCPIEDSLYYEVKSTLGLLEYNLKIWRK